MREIRDGLKPTLATKEGDTEMSEQNNKLQNHKLHHLGPLTIDEDIFRGRFASSCHTGRCKGVCCKMGVWVDVGERDRILEHAHLIRSHMDSGQQREPEKWFDAELREDPDFPSGQAAGTQTPSGVCVFLNGAGRCVLQAASQGLSKSLKPFFCFAFPIWVDNGKLAFDEGPSADCCKFTEAGPRDVFDACSDELRRVLGEEGLAELRSVADARRETISGLGNRDSEAKTGS